jgi:hypothetical protein
MPSTVEEAARRVMDSLAEYASLTNAQFLSSCGGVVNEESSFSDSCPDVVFDIDTERGAKQQSLL